MAKLFDDFKKFKNRTALIDGKKKITFKKLIIIFDQLSNILKKRSLILILCNNSLGSIISYLFCLYSNHVVILIDKKISAYELKKLVLLYKPNYIVSNELGIIKNVKKKIFKFNIFDSNLYSINSKKIQLKSNLQLLLPTSGSMSSAKFVRLSKSNLYRNTKSIIKYLKLNKKDVAITNMPFFYSYMLSIINTHLHVGGSIVISKDSIIQKKFWDVYSKNKITSFNGVPYVYELLFKIGINKILKKNLRYVTQAGGKLDETLKLRLWKIFEKKNIDFFVMYGQTEASPRISYIKNNDLILKKGSIGKSIDGVKIFLKDYKNQKILTPYLEGNIHCIGKNVMLGYSKNLKDLNNCKNSEELNTGDIGFFDKDKYFFIRSRAKRICKIYGIRLDLEDLEKRLLEYGIKIISVSNDKKIGIFYNPSKKVSLKKIREKVEKITNQHSDIFLFTKLKKIPRTANQKIDYNSLKKLL
tara:strand:+ start:4960 stop:6372 length:1413 start_codon:yes stop_codon:yes gene_type:complete